MKHISLFIGIWCLVAAVPPVLRGQWFFVALDVFLAGFNFFIWYKSIKAHNGSYRRNNKDDFFDS